MSFAPPSQRFTGKKVYPVDRWDTDQDGGVTNNEPSADRQPVVKGLPKTKPAYP